MMVPTGTAERDFIPHNLLALAIFVTGFGVIIWTVLVLAMMKSGPDRWTYGSGTLKRIRLSKWRFLAVGVVLVAIATAIRISSESDTDNSEGQIAAGIVQAHTMCVCGSR